MKTRFFILLALLLVAPTTAQTRYLIQPESRLWIDGTSTVNSFTCETDNVIGYGLLDDATMIRLADTAPRAEVAVPVASFDCGDRRMNADFYEAMQAAHHPLIRFELIRTEALGGAEAAYQLRAEGRLTIAGTTRRIDMALEGRHLPGDRLRGTGAFSLKMTDFGIDPPSALFGLIKAHDRITVRFDLSATTQPNHATN